MAIATAVSAALTPIANNEKKAVEYGEVDVDRIQNQFNANEHGEQVASGKEPIDAYKHHEGGNHQIIFHWYHNSLSFTCNHNSAHDTCQQQDADDFERQYILILIHTHEGVSDGAYIEFTINKT